QEALKKQVAEGLPKKLVGFEMVDRGIPRHNYKVAKDGKEIGYVTTGSYSPTLDKNIGNAFVPVTEAKIGNEIDVIVRDRPLKARIIKVPFYKRKK
ncbi:MAG: glycine cleavage T C-terminal barrel domain-containing protein, partial [Bacillota bacterium]